MKSNWHDEAWAELRQAIGTDDRERIDLADCVYLTRLLGRDPELVLHGGGNTSVKTVSRDELGRELAVLRVKGSGWDMGEIQGPGLPAVALEPLRALRALPEMSDERMVNAFRRHLLDSQAPTPSVETLLHAFLPQKFIAHTHADAVLALVNQPDAAARAAALAGEQLAVVPYIMPGFALAAKALAAYQAQPRAEGLLLLHHGIITWGESAKEAYERMIKWVDAAERAVAQQLGRQPFGPMPKPSGGSAAAFDLSAKQLAQINHLRRLIGEHPKGIGLQFAIRRQTSEIQHLFQRSDWRELLVRGPITPDHIIRTKQAPLILEACENEEAFRVHASEQLAAYIQAYERYFSDQLKAKAVQRQQLSPLPALALLPGIGVLAFARDAKTAQIALDLFEHDARVALIADEIGRYQPLDASQLFDMEYWSLEQAKLGKSQPAPLAGHVVLITGAAGGIGAATAETFAARGAQLVLTDRDAEPLSQLAERLQRRYRVSAIALAGDLVAPAFAPKLIEAALAAFGGLDLLVSNAGRAFTGEMADATDGLLASLDINLISHQRLAAAAMPCFLRQGRGCLLFNASKSALNPGPGFGPYSVAKAALIALMRQYAVEYADRGIRASAVNADRVRTGLFDLSLIQARAAARGLEPDAYFRANLLQREVTSQDVANAFLQLYLAEKTTAAIYAVDGGNLAAAPR